MKTKISKYIDVFIDIQSLVGFAFINIICSICYFVIKYNYANLDMFFYIIQAIIGVYIGIAIRFMNSPYLQNNNSDEEDLIKKLKVINKRFLIISIIVGLASVFTTPFNKELGQLTYPVLLILLSVWIIYNCTKANNSVREHIEIMIESLESKTTQIE